MNVADTLAIPYRPAEAVEGGLELARKVGEAYLALAPDVVVVIGGSVGRGDADRYSDLELFAIWHRLPSKEERTAIIQALGGDLWTMDRDGETMEHFGIGELPVGDRLADGTSMVSVGHHLRREVDKAIHRVFDLYETDPEDHAFLAIFRDAVPLEEKEPLSDWQDRLKNYPEELTVAVIRENLGFGPWFVPQALALRGDRLALHTQMHVIERCLLRILSALNDTLVAFPTGKWASRSDRWLTIQPQSLRERLERGYASNLAAGWNEMHALILEMIDLVERHFPKLTTENGENLYAFARRRWDPLPPYTLMLEASLFIEKSSE